MSAMTSERTHGFTTMPRTPAFRRMDVVNAVPIEDDGDMSIRALSVDDRAATQKSRAGKEATLAFHDFARRFWLHEWLWWLFGALSVSGIVIVLAHFDGQALPSWPYGITLGALVSFLATLASIGLVNPLVAGIGNEKWQWFVGQSDRCMADFELIDQASRGPLKAAWLICRMKGGTLAVSGATLSILMLAINPFVQQVIQTAERDVVNTEPAVVPIAKSYDESQLPGQYGVNLDPDLSMKAAIQRGLLDISANASTFAVNPQCSTGNCTWPSYQSLAFCSRCSDVSSQLSTQAGNSTNTSSLPNGISIDWDLGQTQQGFISMTVNVSNGMSENVVSSLAYPDWTDPIADVFTIIAPYSFAGNIGSTSLFGPFASECILQLCIQDLSATTDRGVFTETIAPDPIYINDTLGTNTSYTTVPPSSGFGYDWNTAKAISDWFALNFPGSLQQSNTPSPVSQWPSNGVAQSIWYWTNNTASHMPTQLFENIASSMSSNMRRVSNLTYAGTTFTQQTVVVVRWPWMSLPFVAVILVACYLVALSVRRSSLNEPWKTSTLAILMHGLLDDESRALIVGTRTIEEMNEVADNVAMRLRMTYDGDDLTKPHIGLMLTKTHLSK